eukprot:361041-Chlamydomonas_euryale.AAC.2
MTRERGAQETCGKGSARRKPQHPPTPRPTPANITTAKSTAPCARPHRQSGSPGFPPPVLAAPRRAPATPVLAAPRRAPATPDRLIECDLAESAPGRSAGANRVAAGQLCALLSQLLDQLEAEAAAGTLIAVNGGA